MTPKLQPDGIRYTDLLQDGVESKVRFHKGRDESLSITRQLKALATACNMAFSVKDAKDIPLPGNDTQIFGRKLHVALFDKKSVVSNVQTISAVYQERTPLKWKFSNRVGR